MTFDIYNKAYSVSVVPVSATFKGVAISHQSSRVGNTEDSVGSFHL